MNYDNTSSDLEFPTLTPAETRTLRNFRTWIHRNLFIAVLLQVCIRLVLYIDQALTRNIPGSHNETTSAIGIENTPYLCEGSYIMLEYGVTSMFFWMLIEGLFLNKMISANALRAFASFKFYFFLGWVVPAILTAMWAVATAIYYSDRARTSSSTCWYGYNFTRLYWILQAPRLGVILVNMVFLLIIMRNIVEKLKQSIDNDIERLKKAVRAALVLLPLLGITNVLNMIEGPIESKVWVFATWSYTTHFLGSFQGFFLCLLYCFINTEVQAVLKRHYQECLLRNELSMRKRNTRRSDATVEEAIGTVEPGQSRSFLERCRWPKKSHSVVYHAEDDYDDDIVSESQQVQCQHAICTIIISEAENFQSIEISKEDDRIYEAETEGTVPSEDIASSEVYGKYPLNIPIDPDNGSTSGANSICLSLTEDQKSRSNEDMNTSESVKKKNKENSRH